MKNFLKKYGEDMTAIDNALAQRGDDLEDADLREERKAEYAEKCRKACEGLPDGAIDGGWTAAGMSAYAAKLEHELKRAIRQNECDMLLTADELRQCRAALRPNVL